jgi:hypothetical protein
MLRDRQTTGTFVDPGDRVRRVNLLNWDGKGRPEGLFPPRRVNGSAGPATGRGDADAAGGADGHADAGGGGDGHGDAAGGGDGVGSKP